MLAAELVEFLEELKLNNRKAWFDANRARYDAVRAQFLALVGDVIARSSAFDRSLAGLAPANCVFRINRDTRFSADKSPYKTAMSAVLSPGNRDKVHVGYYFEIDAGDTLTVGGGLHMPPTAELRRIRAVLAERGAELNAILARPAFRKAFGSLEGDALKRVPREYPPDHPHADLLRYKSFTALNHQQASVIPDDRLAGSITGLFETLSPLVAFMAGSCS